MSSAEVTNEVAANGESTNRRGRPSRVAAQNASKSLKELVKTSGGGNRTGGATAGKRGRPKDANGVAKPRAPKKAGGGRGRPAKKAAVVAAPVESSTDAVAEAPAEKAEEEPVAAAAEE